MVDLEPDVVFANLFGDPADEIGPITDVGIPVAVAATVVATSGRQSLLVAASIMRSTVIAANRA